MKEMKAEDKQRIEKEAEHWMQNLDPLKMHPYHGYVTGATAEHERMAELLKEERNKAIDECKREIQFMHDISLNANYQFVYSLAIENLEKLKSQ